MRGKNIELIQQWQALGRVPPELLKDEALETCKKVELTSLQSYVYWAEVEKRPGVVDFSTYDELVEKIREHGLKWVPFLIIGPHYATPKWFQKTNESVYAKCLEHGRKTKIQSIWNPYLPKYVDRFLRLFSEHFRDSGAIESIELGISGNWGEALFPVTGGFSSPKDFHTHPGWWCGDRYAISDFQRFIKDRYKSIEKVNRVLGENFRSFREVEYPEVMPSFLGWFTESLENLVKLGIKTLSRKATFWDRGMIGTVRLKYPPLMSLKNPHKRMHHLDFVQWYVGSMTRWAEFWIRTAQKYFPKTKVYLAVGGDGSALLGADFSEQARVAAKHKAGIRITNQEDYYPQTFVLGRWISCACRFYGAYYATEEAWHSSPEGEVARIFDTATSGAVGIYFKDLISEVIDIAWTKYPKLGKPTKNADSFVKNSHHIKGEKPVIEVAVLLPNTSIALNPLVLNSIYSKSIRLRDVLDFDYVDENMIEDGALKNYRFLIILSGIWVRPRTLVKVKEWLEKGGILVDNNIEICDVEKELPLGKLLGSSRTHMRKIKRGYWVSLGRRHRDSLAFIKDAIYNKKGKYPWKGLSEIDDEWDGVYATRFSSKILYYNSTNTTKMKRVTINNFPKKLKFGLKLEPHSIIAVNLPR